MVVRRTIYFVAWDSVLPFVTELYQHQPHQPNNLPSTPRILNSHKLKRRD